MKYLPLIFACVLLITGCAAAGGGGGGRGQGGVRLDRLDALVDVEGLRVDLEEADFIANIDTVLFGVRFDERGQLVNPQTSTLAVSPDVVDRLKGLVSEHAIQRGNPNSYGYFTVALGSLPSISVYTPLVSIPPQINNMATLRRPLNEMARRGTIGMQATVNLLVGQDGQVEDWQLSESSGSQEVDLQLMAIARQATFTRAYLDRFPQAVWVEFPIGVLEADDNMDPPPIPPLPTF